MLKSILVCLLLPAAAFGVSVQPGDQVTIPARTIYNDGNLALPDSVRVHVFHEGSEVFDGWYNDADIEAFTNDGWLIFSDQLQDIDGPGGSGHYLVLARAYDNDSSLYTPFLYHFEVGLTDTIFAIVGTLQNHDDWVSSLTDADRIGLDLDNIFGTLDCSYGIIISYCLPPFCLNLGYYFISHLDISASAITLSSTSATKSLFLSTSRACTCPISVPTIISAFPSPSRSEPTITFAPEPKLHDQIFFGGP